MIKLSDNKTREVNKISYTPSSYDNKNKRKLLIEMSRKKRHYNNKHRDTGMEMYINSTITRELIAKLINNDKIEDNTEIKCQESSFEFDKHQRFLDNFFNEYWFELDLLEDDLAELFLERLEMYRNRLLEETKKCLIKT